MLHTLHQAEQAAKIPALPSDVPFLLSSKALLLFEVLFGVAAQVSDRRGYASAVSIVHFFCPAEVVADACGMARSTLYLKLAELREVGLVDARAHYVTHRGNTRSDGSVWAVKMRCFEGQPARVPYDALKASYRCLSADIEAGRTAWAEIRQSKDNPSKVVAVERLLAWALPPSITKEPVRGMTVRPDLERVLDLAHLPRDERNKAVRLAAEALAMTLQDHQSVNFWQRLLWQLLRVADAGQGEHLYSLYLAACRARADVQEGFGRRPGALLVSRLKQAPWWHSVWSAASSRVGTKPIDTTA